MSERAPYLAPTGIPSDWGLERCYKRREVIGDATLYLGDCLDILPHLKGVDAVVTDPPYGVGMDGGNVGYKGFNDFKKMGWDKAPPDPAFFLWLAGSGLPYIIWGGNYFGLPPSRCYLVWDKGAGFKGRSYAESELALTNLDANARTFAFDPLARGTYRGKLHPTQKPVELMTWCLSFLPHAHSVVDPFMGSGSTGVACAKAGRAFIGIEANEGYFDIACRRIEDTHKQGDFFVEKPKPVKQEPML